MVYSLQLMEEAQRAGVSRFVLSPTAAVYASSETPLGEDSPIDPANVYGFSKLAIEQAKQRRAAAQSEGNAGEDAADERRCDEGEDNGTKEAPPPEPNFGDELAADAEARRSRENQRIGLAVGGALESARDSFHLPLAANEPLAPQLAVDRASFGAVGAATTHAVHHGLDKPRNSAVCPDARPIPSAPQAYPEAATSWVPIS